MKRYRFKTEAEFRACSGWNESNDLPTDWCDEERYLLGTELTGEALKEYLEYEVFYIDYRKYVHYEVVEITTPEIHSGFKIESVKEFKM